MARVLVVGRTYMEAIGIARIIRRLGHDSGALDDVDVALTYVRSGSYDMAVAGCRFPENGGLRFLRELRAKPGTLKFPLLLYSFEHVEGLEQTACVLDSFLLRHDHQDWEQQLRDHVEKALASVGM